MIIFKYNADFTFVQFTNLLIYNIKNGFLFEIDWVKFQRFF